MNGAEIIKRAKTQLIELTGQQADTVSGLRQDEGRWIVTLDMIERKSIPDSRDILGIYEVVLDEDGNLLSYKRTRRYHRGDATEL